MLRSALSSSLLVTSGLFGACASAPAVPESTVSAPASAMIASLERVCVAADGRSGRSSAGPAYMIDSPRGRRVDALDERECFFPISERAGWARVQSVPGSGASPRSIAIGHLGEGGAGGASFELGVHQTISRATIGGPVELSWTWDETGRTLTRFDFVWTDARVTVGGRLGGTTRVHLGREVPGKRLRVWESTVFAPSDSEATAAGRAAPGNLQEASVADGPLAFPMPTALSMSGIHPICPLTDREIWEDFDGRVPRVQRCVRGGADWLRIERDAQGRIVTVSEDPSAAGGPQSVRTIHIGWNTSGSAPASLSVERDGMVDGLEARFDAHGVPTLTRHHRLGHIDGLEVQWQDVRARAARLYVDGVAGPARTIVPRSSVDVGRRGQPHLSIELPILPEPEDRGAAWLD